MLDRKKSPKFQTAENINFVKAKTKFLDNGIPYYYINAGEQEVVKINFLFEAGTVNSSNPLIGETTNAMLNEGTKELSAAQIAQIIDFYGAYISQETGRHNSGITLYTLNKHLEKTVAIVYKMLTESTFPEKETETYLKKEFQDFLIDKEKPEFLARTQFYKTIFGSKHVYANNINENHFAQVNKEQLVDFYNNYYNFSKLSIIASGKIKHKHFDILNKYFGNQTIINTSESLKIDYTTDYKPSQNIFIEKKDAVQASIKIGHISITKKHPDFIKLSVANTFLGGYFGSRLMANIREDKGYTYGIYSANVSQLHSGFIVIAAETGKEVYQKAIDEVFKELKIFRTTLVKNDELNRVKNYLTGQLASSFDGPFSLSSAFQSLLEYNLDYSFFDNYFNTIKNITAEEIRDTAQKYLNEETMSIITSCSK